MKTKRVLFLSVAMNCHENGGNTVNMRNMALDRQVQVLLSAYITPGYQKGVIFIVRHTCYTVGSKCGKDNVS